MKQSVDTRHVGVAELGVQLRLVDEALDEDGIGSQLVAQNLDRNFALEHHVDALEDMTYATGAEALGDEIGTDPRADKRCRRFRSSRLAFRSVNSRTTTFSVGAIAAARRI